MLNDLYLKTPYEDLVPEVIPPVEKKEFKFNSMLHFISWIEGLNVKFKRRSTHDSSDSRTAEEFCSSKSLEDAFEILRSKKFDTNESNKLQSFVSRIKKNTKFSDEGYELDIAEHLAGSDKPWIENLDRSTYSRVIDLPLFIEGGYSSYVTAEEIERCGLNALSSIYNRGVIPRKMVIVFRGEDMEYGEIGEKNEVSVFIDVEFSDLNGIAKALHPSTLRRLLFRLYELYPNLNSGYGHPKMDIKTEKGLLVMQTEIRKSPVNFEKDIDTFLGVKMLNSQLPREANKV